MIAIDLKPSNPQLKELREILTNERVLTRAVKNALNDTARKSATAIRRKVAAEMNVPIRTLGSSTGKHAHGMIRPLLATDQRLESRVRLLAFNIPLIKTRTTPHRGESFPLGKIGNGQSLDNSPFKQTMHSGHVGWYEREPGADKRIMSAGTYEGKKRIPIKQIFAKSPRETFEQLQSGDVAEANRELERQIKRQVARYLSRKG